MCVYDIAERVGLEVRFVAGSSLGGLYARGSNIVIVPSERPPARQAFTCAHEIGHWFFDHGTRVDQLVDVDDADGADPEELLANIFAAYLLMPAKAVEVAFTRRGWVASAANPFQIYVVAGQLGVGYETLVRQLCWSLGALSDERTRELLKVSVKEIRERVLPANIRRLVVADEHWRDVPIDLAVGDVAIIPKGCQIEGNAIRAEHAVDVGQVVAASLPGVARVESTAVQWASFVRVSRSDFVGRSLFRYLEDPDAEPA